MKKFLLLLALLLAFPITFAGDATHKNKSGGSVVLDIDGQVVGEVVIATRNWAWIWVEFKRGGGTLQVGQRGFHLSEPPGPMLFFELPDCAGTTYIRPDFIDNDLLSSPVAVVPGIATSPDPSWERYAYMVTTPQPGVYQPKSEISPEGFCNPYFGDAIVWPAKRVNVCKYSDDLHQCFPPPYEYAR